MMKIVIIEDEEFAARRLQGMIQNFDGSVQVLATLESVADAVEWFRSNPEPDLIFLDIHLEDGLGFTIFEKVQVTTPIIFTTAFDEYAIKAFKLKSIDYLLKPITQEDLNNAILKYKDWQGSQRHSIDVEALYEIMSNKMPQYKTRFSITVGQKIKTIPVDDIAYFYSEESITFLVTKDKSEYPLDYSLDKLGGELEPKEFFRINRQFIVSLHSIGSVHIYPKSHLKIDLTPPSQKEIFVSIDKVTAFKEWLNT
jgi:DNA-binding LytR/AlgR family response regulator